MQKQSLDIHKADATSSSSLPYQYSSAPLWPTSLSFITAGGYIYNVDQNFNIRYSTPVNSFSDRLRQQFISIVVYMNIQHVEYEKGCAKVHNWKHWTLTKINWTMINCSYYKGALITNNSDNCMWHQFNSLLVIWINKTFRTIVSI